MKKQVLLSVCLSYLAFFCFSSINAMEPKRYALISVSDKTNIEDVAEALLDTGYEILSTGNTYNYLKTFLSENDQSKLHAISDITQFPEILGGRVKTLHPKIIGGILAKRDIHQEEIAEHQLPLIDVVIVNFYPFQEVVKKAYSSLDDILENIDIGGLTLVRSAAKNYKNVVVITDPEDYSLIIEKKEISENKRAELAQRVFAHTSRYDAAIKEYFATVQYCQEMYSELSVQKLSTCVSEMTIHDQCDVPEIIERCYTNQHSLKYGMNPHQKQASILTIDGKKSPFKFLNGGRSYINMLDAIESWQLVREAKNLFGIPCAASYKHTSPAGVGLGIPLSEQLSKIYDVQDLELSDLAIAFIRARNADPKSSFGDFIALSDEVDESTALLIAREVSDGIIAPGFSPKALEILKKKKEGAYVIIEVDPDYENKNPREIHEMFGIALVQEPNRAVISEALLTNIVSENKLLSSENKADLLLALITLKYTKSNSVVYAQGGQVIGVGCGQQNRVDCIHIAGKKADLWCLRQHPRIQEIVFKKGVKRVDRNNAILNFISGKNIDALTEQPVCPLSKEERKNFLANFYFDKGVCMASDAFLPFEDNVEAAAAHGVQYIVQTGGSSRDNEVTQAANICGMVMIHSGLRSFTH